MTTTITLVLSSVEGMTTMTTPVPLPLFSASLFSGFSIRFAHVVIVRKQFENEKI
jgi:hypothetical protein